MTLRFLFVHSVCLITSRFVLFFSFFFRAVSVCFEFVFGYCGRTYLFPSHPVSFSSLSLYTPKTSALWTVLFVLFVVVFSIFSLCCWSLLSRDVRQ